MNHAELVALVEQREKEKKSWVSLPVEDLRELLNGYNRTVPGIVAWPMPMETEA